MSTDLHHLVRELSSSAVWRGIRVILIVLTLCICFGAMAWFTNGWVSLLNGIACATMLLSLVLNVVRLWATQTSWGQLTAPIEAVVAIPEDNTHRAVQFHQSNGRVLVLWSPAEKIDALRTAAASRGLPFVQTLAEQDVWTRRSKRATLVHDARLLLTEVADEAHRLALDASLCAVVEADLWGTAEELDAPLRHLELMLLSNSKAVASQRPTMFHQDIKAALDQLNAAMRG